MSGKNQGNDRDFEVNNKWQTWKLHQISSDILREYKIGLRCT